jgi:putative tricarboxylic transport membrane protein
VLGKMLEENFVTSMIKANYSLWGFFDRPIAGLLGAATLVILFWPVGAWLVRQSRRAAA